MATASVEVSAQAILSHAEDRIRDLEETVTAIDSELRICESSEVSRLMTKRRSCDDERAWLSSKLSQYKTASDLEQWQAARDRLNEAWAPLAERRIAAIEELRVRVEEVVSAIASLNAVHAQQRTLLVEFTPLDDLRPKHSDSAQRNIQVTDTATQLALSWVAQTLRPLLPTGARFSPPDLVPDVEKIPYRNSVL